MKKTFVLYDGRAVVDTDSALAMDTAYSENEARKIGLDDWGGYDYIWWEYDVNSNNVLSNGVCRADLPPCNNFTQ